MNRKDIIIFLAVSALTFFLFRRTFSAYFFQDDWFSLSISQAKTPGEFFSFFIPRAELIYYRPLGMQLPFSLNQVFFGLNPFPFRVATFTFHLFNGYLLFRILEFFLKQKRLAVYGAFLYLTASVHLTIFYWAATFAFVLAPALYFLSLLSFLNNNHRSAFVFFVIGLLTNELLVTLPLIISIFLITEKQFVFRKTFHFWSTSILYILFRLRYAFPTNNAYQRVSDGTDLLRSVRDYWLWTFNWPEEIHNQFTTFFRLNPIFLNDFGGAVTVFLLGMLVFIVCFWILPVWQLTQQKKVTPGLNSVLFGLGWFFVALLPVFYFGQHRYAYYLPIPLAGMLLGSLKLFQIWSVGHSRKLSAVILLFTGFLWYQAAGKNIEFNTDVHWAPRRATLSRKIIAAVTSLYPVLPRRSVVVIGGQFDAGESKWALGDQNALRVVYHDLTLTTFYGTKTELKELNRRIGRSGPKLKIVEIL